VTFGIARLLLEEGHEAARGFLGVPNLVWQWLNLGLFLAVLWYFLRKPVAAFFGGRRADVEKSLAKADDDRRRAEDLAKELASRLATIETELQALRDAARHDAEVEHAALLSKSQIEADQILAKTRADLDNRVRAARVELTAFAGDLSIQIARELLAKSVTAEDETRLVDQGIADLRSAGRNR
jgi:F-type H+-transporting ATPase subunit b